MKRIRYFHRTPIGKVFFTFLGIVLAAAAVIFSPGGNRLTAPLIEKSLSSALSTPITLQEYVLTPNQFQLIFQDEYGNTFTSQGGFSLLTLRMYAHYRLSCFLHGGINPLLSPFKTEGSLSGGISSFLIQGNGDMFGGDLIYKIELHRFRLASLNLKADKIFYEPIMQLLKYPSDTDTVVTGEIDLKGFDQRYIEGSIRLDSKTRRFSPTPIEEDGNESVTLKSLLADEYGDVRAFAINVTIESSLEHAGILEQFVGIPMGGSLKLSAVLSGDEKLLHLKARTDVAKSDSTLSLTVRDLEPSEFIFDSKHADLEQLFTLFARKSPITGSGDLYGELNTTGGNVNAIITKAATVPNVLHDAYQITQPLIRFDAEVNADLNKKGVHYRGTFKSDLGRMEIDNTTTHDQMLRDLLTSLPSGSRHR